MVRYKVNMPELPEVTTVIGVLNPELKNKKIVDIDIQYKNIIQNDVDFFKETLLNKEILFLTRLGKFIIFHLSDNVVMISHLRMEGKYTIINKSDSNPPHTCVVFYLDDEKKLVYYDTRKFGILKLSTEATYLSEKPLSQLGPEPMSVNNQMKPSIFKKLSRKKHIKELLLDQTIMSGIGNIYADEILYKSGINPLTLGSNLTNNDFEKILINAVEILEKAIELGGSTIKSYHPKEGVDGKFQINLLAYGKKDTPCPKCNTRFHKIFLGGRGTTFCPNCQIDKSLKKGIAITGVIGSGKTTILNIFSSLGYATFSCDSIVEELYANPEVIKKISKMFSNKVIENNRINKKFLRNYIENNEEMQEKLENYVFPLVEEKLIEIIKNNDEPIIEVPLLFKAHLEYLFKTIIIVESDDIVILNRIEKSRSYNATSALETYRRNNKNKNPDNLKIVRIRNDFDSIHKLETHIKNNIIHRI